MMQSLPAHTLTRRMHKVNVQAMVTRQALVTRQVMVTRWAMLTMQVRPIPTIMPSMMRIKAATATTMAPVMRMSITNNTKV
jgi:hypothetical protein